MNQIVSVMQVCGRGYACKVKNDRSMLKRTMLVLLVLFSFVNARAQVNVTASGGTASAGYTTVKAAFDAINAGTHTGIISLGISANTTEAASAVLNASGNGLASYSAISISPTGGAARTITGAITGHLIDLNGADNVTIDGLNTGGNTLTIANTATGASSTLRFIADASNNKISNVSFTGSTTSFGVVFFSTGTTTGNDGNKISTCNIGPAGTNLPLNGVYSLGTSAAIDNSSDTLSTNNVFDYFSAASATTGIQLAGTGNSAWALTSNRLYQTASRIHTTANTHSGISIQIGSGYTITGNVIGFANSTGTGTTNIIGNSVAPTGTFPSSFTATGTTNATRYIALNCNFTAGGVVSQIDNNTMAGFALYTSSGASTTNGIWCGINVTAGKVNIGTAAGNTIGVTSGQSSIYTTASTANGAIVGIYVTGTDTVNIKNNVMGGVDASARTASTAGTFTGIDVAGSGSFNISGNTIGNTTANNIRTGYFLSGANLTNATGTATTATGTSSCNGIRSAATGNYMLIYNNTIRGMNVSGSATVVTGITSSGAMTGTAPTAIIDTNALGTAALNFVTYAVANSGTLTAISLTNTVATTHAIRKNDIRGITYSTAGSGINNYLTLTGATAAGNTATISDNTFTNLSINTTGSVTFINHGYTMTSSSTQTFNNNSIVTAFNKAGAGGTVTLFTSNSVAAIGSIGNMTNNNFSNIAVTGATILIGFNNTDGGGSSTAIRTVTGNTFNNWTGGTSAVTGMLFNYIGTGTVISNNTITNITGQSTIIGLTIGSSFSGASFTCASNAINSLSSTGTGGNVTGFTCSNTSTLININDNTIHTLSSTGASSTVLGLGITGAGVATNVYANTIHTLTASGTTSPLVNGLSISSGTSINAYGNRINTLTNAGATTPTVNGISVSGGTTVSVHKNKIYDLLASAAFTGASGVNGISLSGGTTVTVYNNILGDLRATTANTADAVRGISVGSTTASSTYNVYFNSVHLNAGSSGTNFGTSGIYHAASATATTAVLNLRNNIIYNISTPAGTGQTVAFRRSVGTANTLNNYASTSNNNLFYAGTAGATRLIYADGTSSAITLADYKAGVFTAGTVSGRDANSVSEVVNMVNSTASNTGFFHITGTPSSQIESGGATIAGIEEDFDGNARTAYPLTGQVNGGGSAPDIGADEFDGEPLDLNPPSFSYTNLSNAPVGTSRSLLSFATIADPSKVDSLTNKPRIYYKKASDANAFLANTSAANGWKWVATTSTGSPFAFTLDYTILNGGTVSVGDTIQYFVVAQDLAVPTPIVGASPSTGFVASSVSSITTAPTTPNQFILLGAWSGTYTIGGTSTGPGSNNYVSLSEAIADTKIGAIRSVYVTGGGSGYGSVPTVTLSGGGGTGAAATAVVSGGVVTQIMVTAGGSGYTSAPVVGFIGGTPTVAATATANVSESRSLAGATVLELTSTYNSDMEDAFPIVLNEVSNNSASNTITIRPATGTMPVITGSSTTGIISIDGGKNYVIDGRAGGAGTTRGLTIVNTSATSAAYTVRMVNDATHNVFRYDSIQGASTGTTTGTIVFGTTTGTTGNDNNTIEICNIGSLSTTSTNAIYALGSTGSAALNNSTNTITNNYIFNYFDPAQASIGISILGGNTDWTISSNKFFQTVTRTQTTGAAHTGIAISNTSGNNFSITGNHIGYTSSAATGFYTLVGISSSSVFNGISLSVGTTTASSVQGNTITAINLSGPLSGTTSSASFKGIYISSGLVNVGNVSGNTIGSMTDTGSISFSSSSASAGDVLGIFNFGSSNWTANNNQVGGITARNTSTGAANIYGIRVNTSTSVTFTCQNNTIGGNVAGSIRSASSATGTIVNGILTSAPASTITGNTVRNLVAAGGTGTTTSAAVNGIVVSATSTNHDVSQNIVHSLSDTNTTAAVTVAGITFSGSSGTNTISRNLIHSLDNESAAGSIHGINVVGGTATYSNNMIRLGIDASGASVATAATINGILESGGTNNHYFNTIYVGGTNVETTASNTYAFQSSITTTRIIRNNIFYNVRSNATTGGKHYAARVAGTTVNPSGLTIDNNIYLASGTGGVIGFYNSADVNTLYAWRTAIGQDEGSYNNTVSFTAASGTSATVDLHISSPTTANVTESGGAVISGITSDYDTTGVRTGYPLTAQVNGGGTAPDIGADEYDGTPAAVMTYVSSTAVQQTTGALKGVNNQAILRMVIVNTGVASAVNATQFTVNANGSTAIGDITNAKIYFTDTSSTFSSTSLFGSNATPSTSNFTVTGSQQLSEGNNYFWLAYDVSAAAVAGNLIDGEFVNATVGGSVKTPTGGAPSGNRVILGPMSGTYAVGASQVTPNFTTLTNAVIDLTARGVSGPVIFSLMDTLYSTSETFPITIAGVTGISTTNTVTIRPDASFTRSITITGSNTTAIIDLNGATYITIDGRPGGTGSNKYLTVQNTSTTAASAGNAILLRNESSNNTLTYLDVQSANQNPASNAAVTTIGSIPGAIAIGSTAGSNGNDNNMVSFCNIHSISAGGNLGAGIYSGNATTAGTAANNDNNTFTNNNVYGFYLASAISTGINVSAGCNTYTITNNSIYQPEALSYGSGTQTVRGFWITPNTASLTSASGYIISGNYIGGTAASCGGTAMTLTGTAAYQYYAMDISVGVGTASEVHSNTLTNWNFTGGWSTNNIYAINIANGNVNVGALGTGNTIGSATVNGAITLTTTVANGSFIALRSGAGGTIVFSHNTISGIDMVGNATNLATGFNGIAASGGTTVNITNNTIGSTTLANSINMISVSATSTTATAVRGIINNGTATASTISNNTIANINTNYASTTSGNILVGIVVASGTGSCTVSNNTVRDLTTASAATGTGISQVLAGIIYASTVTPASISQNTVYNLSNTAATGAVQVTGLYYSGPTTGTNVVSKNRVYGMGVASNTITASLYGLRINSGISTVSNNEISLGTDGSGNTITNGMIIQGISDIATATPNNFYFNSVRISGTGVANTVSSHAFSSTVTTGSRDYRNNSFSNERSFTTTSGSATIKNYAAAYAGTLSSGTLPTAATVNNNLYYAPGTDGVLITNASNNYTTLAAWQAVATAHDVNSVSADPIYNSLTSLVPFPTTGLVTGATIAGITDDINGVTRVLPRMGAYENTGDLSSPTILYTSLASTSVLTNRTFTATITDPGGVNTTLTTAPRVYYKKATDNNTFGANDNTTNGWKWVETTSPSSPFSFTINYSLLNGGSASAGTTIQYFVVAQDIAGNIGSTPAAGFVGTSVSAITTAPAANSYDLLGVWSGSYTIGGTGAGPAGGATYVSLNEALADINTNIVKSVYVNNGGTGYTTAPTVSFTGGGGTSLTATAVITNGVVTQVKVTANGSNYISAPTVVFTGGGGSGAVATANLSTGREITGAITFALGADYNSTYEDAFPITINAMTGITASNTLTIKPATGVVDTISGSVTSGALIRLNGADYVTIDGSNSGSTDRSLTILNTATTAPTGIALVSLGTGLGATNNVVKNCNISTGVNSSVGYGIAIGGTTPGTAGADNDNNTIQNDTITVAAIGIYAIGNAAVSTAGMDNLTLSGNKVNINTSLGSPIGIKVGNGLNGTINGNTINVQSSATGAVVGISLETGFVSSTVNANNITGVLTTATGGYAGRGITIGGTAASALVISNNLIGGINGSNFSAFTNSSTIGIAIGIIGTSTTITSVAGGISLYHNTVNISGSYTSASACVTTAIFIGSGATTLDIRNNIFVNTLNNIGTGTTSKAYALYSAATNAAYTTLNYNNYYVGGTQGVLGFLSADVATLAALQTATAKDANSINADPLFNSSTVLIPQLISPVLATGTPIGTVTTDFTGATRSGSAPSIGGYESGADFAAPTISYTALSNTTSTSNPTLSSVTITDASNINITGGTAPRLYYKKATDNDVFGANTLGTNGWKWVEATNTTTPFTFTFNYGILNAGSVTLGDVIQYFVVAQDLAATPNISASPSTGFAGNTVTTVTAAPTTPNSFAITGTISGNYMIGGTGSGLAIGANYVSLKEAMGDITVNTVRSIYVTAGGVDYTTAPTVSFIGGGGSGATATAIVSGGSVTQIKVTAAGTGYISAPTVVLTGGGGTGATATANRSVGRDISGAVTMQLTSSYSSTMEDIFPIIIPAMAGSSATNTLTIKPATGVTTTISGAISSNAILRLNGADYVTIDGSNSGGTDRSLTITNTSTSTPTVIAMVSSGTDAGAKFNTVKNCVLSSSATSTGYGISIGGSPGATGSDNDTITIQNNTISGGSVGIYAIGSAAASATGMDSISIIGNTITLNTTTTAMGIRLGNGVKGLISQNTVSVESSVSSAPVGISMEAGFLSPTVVRNTISKALSISASSYGGRGITIATGSATSNAFIANNIIYGVGGKSSTAFSSHATMGIGIGVLGTTTTITDATGGVNLYHNSVNMTGSYVNAASCISTALYIGSAATALDIRNNALVNTLNNTDASGTASKNYSLYSAAANTAFTNINNNSYLASGAQGVLGFLTTDLTSLSALQTATAMDVNSISTDPIFLTSTLLTPNSCVFNDKGTPIASVTTDFAGTTRNLTTPDIGAYEFSAFVAAPTLTSPVMLCQNATTTPLTATGGFTLLWFTAATGGVGSTSVTPSTLVVGTTTYYVADSNATSGCISPRTQQNVTITVPVTGNTITANQTICHNTTPAMLAGSSPAGGDGLTYTYTWMSSTTSATSDFTAATGTNNSQNYSPAPLVQTTWFRRVVASGGCDKDTTAAVQIIVNPVIATNTVSGAQSIITGSTPASITGSTPTGGDGTTYIYQWQSSITSATSGFANASGSTAAKDYSPGALTQNTWYRRVVSSGTCTDTSSAIQVSVFAVLSNNTVGSAQSVCTGSAPAVLTGSVPSGGNGTITYQWQTSTTSASLGYTSASGTSTLQDYTPAVISATTWYRRVATSLTSVDTSTAIQVVANLPVATNTITGSTQTICAATTPSSITASTATGGDGTTYTYQWLSSTSSATTGFSAISSSNTQNYNPAALSATTWYRRIVASGACSKDTTAAIQIVVDQPIANNTITGSAQTVCSTTAPATITASTPTGGDGAVFTYQWLASTTSATAGFSAIASSNTQNYSPAVLSTTTWYRRVVSSGVCSKDTTAALQIVITNPIVTNSITGSTQTICAATAPSAITASLPTGGDGTTYTYQWLISTTSATSGFSAIVSSNTQNYSPGVLSLTSWYRRVVTSGVCSKDTTAAVQIVVDQPIATNSITGFTQTICTGTTPTSLAASLPTGGDGTTYTYQWLISTTSATTGFSAIVSSNTQNYSPGVLSTTTWYRRVVGSGVCSKDTTVAMQIVVTNPIATNSITGSTQTICAATTPSSITASTATGGDGTTYTYQWLSSTSSATTGFSAISSSNTQNYNPAALSATTWYRRIVASGACSKDTTAAIQIVVDQPIANNTITGSAQTVCSTTAPATITASTPTGGDGAVFTYQWLASTTSATAGFSAIASSNTQNYSPAVLSTTTWYRRVVSSGVCSKDTTAALQIVITNPIVTNSITGSTQTICAATAPSAITASLPTGGDGTTYTYQWLISTTSATSGFSAIVSSNTQNYSPGVLSLTSWYRRVVTSGVCSKDTTAAVQIVVDQPIATNSITGSSQTICATTAPAVITASTPTGGDGTLYTYQWLASTTSATAGFSALVSSNTQNLTAPAITATTWYKRVVSSGVCVTDTTGTLLVNVNPQIVASVSINASSTSVCGLGAITYTAIPVNGGSSPAYQWVLNGVNVGTNSNTYVSPTPAVNDSVYVTLSSSATPCLVNATTNSNGIKLSNSTVTPTVSITVTDSFICLGTTATFTAISSNGGSTPAFQWKVNGINAGTNSNVFSSNALVASDSVTVVLTSNASCVSSATANSNFIRMSIRTATAINTQPVSISRCIGSSASFAVVAVGDGARTYLWKKNGADISGANTESYTIPTPVLTDSGSYTVVVTANCGSLTSSVGYLTMTAPVTNNSASGVPAICSGSSPAQLTGTLPAGGNGTTYAYVWQSSTTSASAGFTTATGTTNTQHYQPGVLSQTHWYRRVVTSGVCVADTSVAIQVTVNPIIAGNT
ncbi:MAG: BNR-repeat neuraminidase N-terminal domain-containing protein, partial [Bacteroidota bacterium]